MGRLPIVPTWPCLKPSQLTAACRRWLTLCACYPQVPLVPSLTVGDASHAHRADIAQYAKDCGELTERTLPLLS